MFMWLGPLAGFLKFGTDGYPRAVQRRLRIVNAMALLIAVFSVIYAAVFAYYDAEHYRHLIVVNLLLAVIVLLVPLAHRINDIAAAVLIAIVEYVALFFFVRVFGHESGIQINYIIAAAVAFAIYGLSHFRIAVAVIAAGLVLHLAAWFLFPRTRAVQCRSKPARKSLYFLGGNHVRHHRAHRGLCLHRGKPRSGQGRCPSHQYFARGDRRAS